MNSEEVERIRLDVKRLKDGYIIYNNRSNWQGRRDSLIIRQILRCFKANYEEWFGHGSWVRMQVVCPEIVKEYNRNMNSLIDKLNKDEIKYDNLSHQTKYILWRMKLGEIRALKRLKRPIKAVPEGKFRLLRYKRTWLAHQTVRRLIMRLFPKFIDFRNPRSEMVEKNKDGEVVIYVAEIIRLTKMGKIACGILTVEDSEKEGD